MSSIKDWPEADRPREKLIRLGAQGLTDAELLALFLRTGIEGQSAVDLARAALSHFHHNLAALLNAKEADFCQIKGLGPAKYVQLQATVELARRALASQAHTPIDFRQPARLEEHLSMLFWGKQHEEFWLLCFGAQGNFLGEYCMSKGSLNSAAVYPREILKTALHANAAVVVLAHNHPNGESHPSQTDIDLTVLLQNLLAQVDIVVVDHYVLGGTGAHSMKMHRNF
jgi:DNA repair protein RadC